MGADLKDLSSGTFGLIIAYLLPGLLALFTLSFWSTLVEKQFNAFLQSQSGVGLFLLVVLAALLIGVELTAVRWLIFELIVCKKTTLTTENLAKLQSADKIAAFRVVVDEHYRYHQFWGGLTVVLPFFAWGVIRSSAEELSLIGGVVAVAAGVCIWFLTFYAAKVAFERYIGRAKEILEGENDAQRNR